jgi:hypothetical protein
MISKYSTQNIGLKLAGALLVYHGELSVNDIRAMPFFSGSDESELVIKALETSFKTERYTRKVTSQPIPQWEDVIRLKE